MSLHDIHTKSQNTQPQMSRHHHSSSFPSCFRPSTSTTAGFDEHHPPPSPPSISGNSNLTTSLYQTDLGVFSLTWSRTFFGHSLHLQLHPIDNTNNCSPFSLSNALSLSTISFHLHIKSFIFFKKHGSKKLNYLFNQETNPTTTTPRVQIYWDLSRAKFGSRPEPQSGFYITVVVGREMTLLVGDLTKEAYAKTRARKPERNPVLVLRREHLFGNRIYTTTARFGGRNREISIDCTVNNDARLYFSVDNKRVLQIKRLKWKFRGNERIEVDGVPVQVSWDVYNWLFEDINNGHAVFMFRFETLDPEEEQQGRDEDSEVCDGQEHTGDKNSIFPWQQNQSGSSFGMSGLEWRKMRKSLMRTARSSSSSSISMSSASSSGCSSSVMEWASTEETELSGPNKGFSLLVYAWKK